MNRKIKLLVFDFDGTALGGHEPYARFPSEFAVFLDKLSRNGILWATNTTWAPKEQYKLIKQSGVRSQPTLLTGQTGRLVAKVKSGKVVFDSGHGRMVKAVDLAFRKENRALVNSVLEKFIAGDEIEQFSCNDFDQNIISYKAQKGKALQAWKLIRPLIASGAFYLWEPDKKSSNSLLPYYMNKGAALKIIQEKLHIAPEHTVVAGDATNDLHMFDARLAKYMICPANAHYSIKRIVRKNHGIVSDKKFSWGVIDAMETLLDQIKETLC